MVHTSASLCTHTRGPHHFQVDGDASKGLPTGFAIGIPQANSWVLSEINEVTCKTVRHKRLLKTEPWQVTALFRNLYVKMQLS